MLGAAAAWKRATALPSPSPSVLPGKRSLSAIPGEAGLPGGKKIFRLFPGKKISFGSFGEEDLPGEEVFPFFQMAAAGGAAARPGEAVLPGKIVRIYPGIEPKPAAVGASSGKSRKKTEKVHF